MKRNYYIVALIMLIFFVISFLTNVIGPLIPDIIKVFNLSYTLAGVLPLAFFYCLWCNVGTIGYYAGNI
jgi:FHS family L-fucose permease-like MFS transporter